MFNLVPHEFQLRDEFNGITAMSLLAVLVLLLSPPPTSVSSCSMIRGGLWSRRRSHVRRVGISIHGLDESLDISPFCLSPTQTFLHIPCIPLVSFSAKLFICDKGPGGGLLHDAVDIPLHCLLV